MSTILKMPKLSDTMQEGLILNWLVQEGEAVQIGQALLEVETDKATMEVESPVSGYVLKIIRGSKEKVPLGDVLAVLGDTSENWEEALKHAQAPAQSRESAASVSTSQSVSTPQQPLQSSSSLSSSTRPIKASPYAKKLARTNGINLHEIRGTGPGGRILARDLVLLDRSSSAHQIERPLSGGETRHELSSKRLTIGRRLVESVQNIPHYYLKISVQPNAIVSIRQRYQEQGVSLNDVINYFVAKVLRFHPLLRSRIQGQDVITPSDIHLSFAVGLDDGLVTPVIRYADQKTILELSQESKKLVEKAKMNRLTLDEIQSGHFTTSNLGSLGIEEFTSIINPPQVAILSIGALTSSGLRLTLGCDHRLIDGVLGARFLKDLKLVLEDPSALVQFI